MIFIKFIKNIKYKIVNRSYHIYLCKLDLTQL